MNGEEERQVQSVRQLKMRGMEQIKGGEKVKEKEKQGNKWIIVLILVITIVAALVFKFSSRQRSAQSGGGFNPFGPAEFNYTK